MIEETLALAQRENFRVNVIEAFDQPWKRQLEGSTGGYWGIFDRARQAPKFSFTGVGFRSSALAHAGGWPGFCSPRSDVRRRLDGRPRQGRTAAIMAADRGARRSCRRCCSAGRSRRVPIDSFGRRLAALAGLCAHGRGRADRLRRRLRGGPAAADICRAAAARGETRAMRSVCALGVSLIALACCRSKPRSGWCSIRAIATAFRAAERRRRAVSGADVGGAAQPSGTGSARIAETRRRGRARAVGRSTSPSTRPSPIGRRSGSAPACSASRSFWCGRGTRQAEDQQAGGQRRRDRHCAARCRSPPRRAPATPAASDGRSRLSSAATSATPPNTS